MRDKVKHMLNCDGKVAYVVFSRNPYILHEVQYFQHLRLNIIIVMQE